MIEILAIPGWQAAEITLSAWSDRLTGQGLDVRVTRESTGVSWIEVASLRLRGYAVIEDGRRVEAINFELDGLEPSFAREALARAASALSWELHEDDDPDANDDE